MHEKHEEKECPRCGAAFVCKVSNVVHCQCAPFDLSDFIREAIAWEYGEQCLCATCLSQISRGSLVRFWGVPPRRKEPMPKALA